MKDAFDQEFLFLFLEDVHVDRLDSCIVDFVYIAYLL
jgi:hypothetical protein